ncbi:MAG: hypothetical protein ACXABY_02445 [Candidatus Thorarchaeota archaeon]|jgi:spore coat polysaccharide biosynthesis predicted glycosyltransferase SpsG
MYKPKSIAIYTEADSAVGRGHVVRMAHLWYMLKERGHLPEIIADQGAIDYFAMVNVPAVLNKLATGQHMVRGSDIAIVDVMNNDDKFLQVLRPQVGKLVVIVGAGHTITPTTRWIADLIIYQTPKDNDLYNWVPGEEILQGLEYIMLSPAYATVEPEDNRLNHFAVYFGGGISKRLSEGLITRLIADGYLIAEMGPRAWELNPIDVLRDSTIYLGSMGMMAYEAIACRAYPMVFCRSEDHVEAADRLVSMGLLSNFGVVERASKENSIDNIMDQIESALITYKDGWKPPSWKKTKYLDGKGLYRVAREILADA